MTWPERIAVAVVAAGTLAVYGGSVALSLTRDAPNTLDTAPVRERAAAACTALRTGLDALPPLPASASPAQRRTRLAEQDRLVARLVSDVRALGPDLLGKDAPAVGWLADWEALAAARRAYGGTGPFAPPVQDGRPIPQRMSGIGVPGCEVPAALTGAP